MQNPKLSEFFAGRSFEIVMNDSTHISVRLDVMEKVWDAISKGEKTFYMAGDDKNPISDLMVIVLANVSYIKMLPQ